MAQPTRSDVLRLDTASLGAPFAQVEAKTLNTQRLDWSYLGAPFVAVPAGVVQVIFTPILMVI